MENVTVAERRVGRPPGPRRDPAERREDLLDAAARAIRARGPDVSMADLAGEAGVTRPILYDHFGDRAGVASALAARYTSELEAAVAAAFARAIPLRDAVVEGIEVFCRFVDKEPEVYRFIETATAASHDASIEVAIGSRLGTALSAALGASGADPAYGPTWGYAILGMVFAATQWWSVTRTIPRADLVAHLGALITDGLAGAGIAEVVGPFA